MLAVICPVNTYFTVFPTNNNIVLHEYSETIKTRTLTMIPHYNLGHRPSSSSTHCPNTVLAKESNPGSIPCFYFSSVFSFLSLSLTCRTTFDNRPVIFRMSLDLGLSDSRQALGQEYHRSDSVFFPLPPIRWGIISICCFTYDVNFDNLICLIKMVSARLPSTQHLRSGC